MGVSIYITTTKDVVASLDTTTCSTLTDRFSITNATDIFLGMTVSGLGVVGSPVVTNISGNNITLSSKQIICNDVTLTFRYYANSSVESIQSVERVILTQPITANIGNTVIFTDNQTDVGVEIVTSGSGTSAVTSTSNITVFKFGTEDITYTQDVDTFMTNVPNAYDQEVDVVKDTATVINMALPDNDANAATKTYSVVAGPFAGTTSGLETTNATYTPNTGFTGKDYFTFKANDGSKDSLTKTIFITVK